ncbi:unnamed protein product [Brachionus calyciflorus]|uniref:EGF-like domain-containing protein n=1 Tax=Brachionus calyciflorus TaxID=104777 RepID=A0A814DLI6_9BILA|nr:unnamed protein product [Brachionus calyciflorus]
MFSIIFILSLNILSVKNDYFCRKNEEVHYKTWCYKLYDINYFMNFNECLLDNNSSYSQECLDSKISKLFNIYILNSNLESEYEFTVLKSPFKDEPSANIYFQLIEQIYFKKNKNISFMNILSNIYSFKNHGFIKNQPVKIENPNLLKHSDDDADDNSTERCLFIHQTQNLNEKFIFKYGSCEKKFSFICIKRPIETVENYEDRCSKYSDFSPGGSWIECDKLFNILDQNDRHLMSTSQKCCMYNLNWKVDFNTANKICSQFDSEVFTFKAKGYTKMLSNFDLYLDENYDKQDQANFLNFWTSCKLIDYPNNNEPVCSQDFTEVLDDYDFETPIENGFLIYYLNYSFKNQTGFKLNKFNLSLIVKNLNETDSEFISEFTKNLTTNTYLLVRRKESFSSILKTRLLGTQNLSCFSLSLNSDVSISLPFLDKCFHFRNNLNQNNTLTTISSIDTEYLNEVLNMIDIIQVSCSQDVLNFSKILINSESSCNSLDIVKKRNFDLRINDWKWKLWSVLNNSSSLILQNYTSVEKILELNCYDSFLKIQDLIEECQKFYDDNYCKFKCPDNCDFDKDQNQVLVWQIEDFKYLDQSSICKAAYHSNNLLGLIYFNNYEDSNYSDISLINNGIKSLKWPPVGLEFQNYDGNIFSFINPQINVKIPSFKNADFLVLIKAIHFVSKTKTSYINIKIFSYTDPGTLRLKFLIPLFDDFFHVYFHQETENFMSHYETYLNASLTYKKLIFVNNYFELNETGIKFPINLINIDYGYFLLHNPQTLNVNNEDFFQIKFQPIRNLTYSKKLNCNWFVYNLNTLRPCSKFLNFDRNENNIGQDLIFYPKTEGKDLNFFKKFIRVIFYESNNNSTKCLNNGYFKDGDCVCYPGFGGRNCEISCSRNKFGRNCEFECPNGDCIGYLICNLDPVGCSCASGFTGYYCNEECPKNKWGPKCMFKCDLCPFSECDRFNGSCFCNENSEGKYCEKCKDGFFGLNCTENCEEDCLKCEKESGVCELRSTTSTKIITTETAVLTTLETTFVITDYEETTDFITSVFTSTLTTTFTSIFTTTPSESTTFITSTSIISTIFSTALNTEIDSQLITTHYPLSSYTDLLTSSKMLTELSTYSYDKKCFYEMNIKKCDSEIFYEYVFLGENSERQIFSCNQNEAENFYLCNFVQNFQEDCIENLRESQSNIFCDVKLSLDYSNLLTIQSKNLTQVIFKINSQENSFQFEKFNLLILNTTTKNGKGLENDFVRQNFLFFVSFCSFQDFVVLNFENDAQSSCLKDTKFKSFNNLNKLSGFYDLYTVVEIKLPSSNYTIWIKSTKFTLNLTFPENFSSLETDRSCSNDNLKNSSKCNLVLNENGTHLFCRNIFYHSLLVFSFGLLLKITLDNLIGAIKFKRSINNEDEKFLYDIKFPSLLPSSI